MRALTLSIASLLLPCATYAQSLVKDINTVAPTNPSATFAATTLPGTSVSVGTTTYFAANDFFYGVELWKTDGTAAGTVMVKDINPGTSSSSPANFRNVAGTVFFTATNVLYGTELWKTNGTAAGTVLVADVFPGTTSGVTVTVTDFAVVGTSLFFVGNDGVNGAELWKSDGTPAGTVMVKDINPAAATSSSIVPMAAWGGKVYFGANDGTNGVELWQSDGTAAGTVLLKDINAGSTASNPFMFCDVGALLVFFATDAASGQEPWATDGTAANTVKLKDINGTSTSSTAATSTSVAPVMGGKAYFAATDATNGAELWQSDGTAAGTVLVKDINAGTVSSSPAILAIGSFAVVGTNLYFRATEAASGTELWKTDGTAAGTTLVVDFAAGTASSTMSSLTACAGALVFSATDTAGGAELWKSDGTAAGTVQVKDIQPGSVGSLPASFIVNGATLFFTANDGVVGTELWKSDLTNAGTVLLKDIAPAQPSSSNPANLIAFKGKCFFTATDGVNGTELWQSDGTAAGTTMVLDINPGSASSSPTNLTVALGKLWFAATDATNGTELWVSDGTAAGTTLVKDITAGTGSSSPAHFTEYLGKVYFSAADATYGRELWVSDGTSAGTALFYDFNTGTPSGLTTTAAYAAINVLNGKLLIAATNAAAGAEWWASDGTVANTAIIKDVNPGTASGISGQSQFYNCIAGNRLYWYGNDGVIGAEVFFTDGTAAGTGGVDIWPGSSGSIPFPFYGWNGKCYSQASDGNTGYETWVTDGTAAGTFCLKDCYPGTSSSSAARWTGTPDRLFFYASDLTAGTGTGGEVWVSDGTTANTTVLKDILPGAATGFSSASTIYALGVGRRVVFPAFDGVTGIEWWISDGTTAGTKLLSDLWPGVLSGVSTTAPFVYVPALGRGFTAGNNGATGTELFAFTATQLGITEIETFGVNCKTAGNPTIGTGGGVPALGNATFAETLASAKASTACVLHLAESRVDLPVSGCTVYPAFTPPISLGATTTAGGSASIVLPVPNNPSLAGTQIWSQWAILNAGGAIYGALDVSNGLRIRIGGS